MTCGGSDEKKGGSAAPSGDPPYHVIATDMDGTLLNASHEITPYTKSVLQRVVSKYPPYEVSVVLASGRPHVDVAVHLASLDLPDDSGYIVSSNGARVHRMIRRETDGQSVDGGARPSVELEQIYAATMDPEDVYYLLGLLSDGLTNTKVSIFQGDVWLCTEEWEEELCYFEKSKFRYTIFSLKERIRMYERWKEMEKRSSSTTGSATDKGEEVPCATEETGVERSSGDGYQNPLEDVVKVSFASGEMEKMKKIYEQVRLERPHLLTSYTSPTCMEFNATDVNKGTGLRALLPFLHGLWISRNRHASDDSSGVEKTKNHHAHSQHSSLSCGSTDRNCTGTRGEVTPALPSCNKTTVLHPHLVSASPVGEKHTVNEGWVHSEKPWTLADCCAFGDSNNDVDILKIVGKGFIMGNGSEFLKSALPDKLVIGNNTEDSVARTIEELFLL